MSNLNGLILTFDVELFLGKKTGRIDQCITLPLEKISKILDQNKAKGIFFIDSSFLLRLQQLGAHSQLRALSEAFRGLYSNGHGIELHLHPHWEGATPLGDEFAFMGYENYRFQSLPEAEADAHFRGALEALKTSIGCSSYRPRIFRAGGWCIQPFSHLKHLLQEEEIFIDSSVLHGAKFSNPVSGFDFSGAPEKDWWRFSNDPLVEDDEGAFVEVPASTTLIPGPLAAFGMALLKAEGSKPWGSGSGVVNKGDIRTRLKKFVSSYRKSYSVEATHLLVLKYLMRNYEGKGIKNFVMHPKSLSPHSLACLQWVCERYPTLSSEEIFQALRKDQ